MLNVLDTHDILDAKEGRLTEESMYRKHEDTSTYLHIVIRRDKGRGVRFKFH